MNSRDRNRALRAAGSDDVTSFASRAVERALEPVREQYVAEVETLIAAGHRIMRERGYDGTTLAAVLEEAGLSTRAFYRHFESKDDLLLAMYDRDSEGFAARLEARVAQAHGARARLDAWIDEFLSLAYDERRRRRTALFVAERWRLFPKHPQVVAALVDRDVQSLVGILEEGRADGTFPSAVPPDDARSIFAVAWDVVERRLVGDETFDRGGAMAHVLRFCLPALTGPPGGTAT